MTEPVAPIDPRQIEYVPLDTLIENPRNPKKHEEALITASIDRFGMLDIIVRDERTGYIISGHGRKQALDVARDRGDMPPEGVTTDPTTGAWLVPVVVGWASRSDVEATAALIALNQTTILGGWVDDTLLELLDELSLHGDGLAGVGFDTTAIDDLRRMLDDQDPVIVPGPGKDDPGWPTYSRRTDIPQYEPHEPEAPPLEDLYDTTTTEALLDQIDEAYREGVLTEDVHEFLVAAAHRHTRFRYDRIAEFYAHADSHVQALMEASALVIIDVEDAIAHGWVSLDKTLQSIREIDLADVDDDDDEAVLPDE